MSRRELIVLRVLTASLIAITLWWLVVFFTTPAQDNQRTNANTPTRGRK